MEHPDDASRCHCVLRDMILCHPMRHLPNIPPFQGRKRNPHSLKQTRNTFMSLALLVQRMHLRRFTTFQSHLTTTYPATALCTWRIESHQKPCHRVCSFNLHHIIPPPHPEFVGPWPSLSTASTAAPAARSRSTTPPWLLYLAQCSGVRPHAPKGSENPHLQWEKLQSV